MNVYMLYEVGGDLQDDQVYATEDVAQAQATNFMAKDGEGSWGVETLRVHTTAQPRYGVEVVL